MKNHFVFINKYNKLYIIFLSEVNMLRNNLKLIDITNKKIIDITQKNFPLTTQPFKEIASKLNLTEEEVIKRVNFLIINKIIRRIAPTINTNYFNYYSTLVALKVNEENINYASNIINSYSEVSHNYIRNYKLNIWFTLSSINKERALFILNDIKKKLNCQVLNLPT